MSAVTRQNHCAHVPDLSTIEAGVATCVLCDADVLADGPYIAQIPDARAATYDERHDWGVYDTRIPPGGAPHRALALCATEEHAERIVTLLNFAHKDEGNG